VSDIVGRLRTRNGRPDGFGLGPVCDEAAAEIERLRGIVPEVLERLNDELCAENERLRAAIAAPPGWVPDNVRAALCQMLDHYGDDPRATLVAFWLHSLAAAPDAQKGAP
jgi:hypothetical protein